MEKYFTSLPLYYQDDLTWCVHKVLPPSIRMLLWNYAIKTAWFLVISTVLISNIIIIFFMGFHYSWSGYMKYDFTQFSRNAPIHMISDRKTVSMKICLIFALLAAISISIVWNILLTKAVFRPVSSYQIQTINDLVEKNYQLVGGILAKNAVLESTNVRYFNFIEFKFIQCRFVFLFFSTHLK